MKVFLDGGISPPAFPSIFLHVKLNLMDGSTSESWSMHAGIRCTRSGHLRGILVTSGVSGTRRGGSVCWERVLVDLLHGRPPDTVVSALVMLDGGNEQIDPVTHH